MYDKEDGKLSSLSVDKYKCEHPIPPDHIYKDMFSSHEQYPQIMQVFKLSLLVPPSTAKCTQNKGIDLLLSHSIDYYALFSLAHKTWMMTHMKCRDRDKLQL